MMANVRSKHTKNTSRHGDSIEILSKHFVNGIQFSRNMGCKFSHNYNIYLTRHLENKIKINQRPYYLKCLSKYTN